MTKQTLSNPILYVFFRRYLSDSRRFSLRDLSRTHGDPGWDFRLLVSSAFLANLYIVVGWNDSSVVITS